MHSSAVKVAVMIGLLASSAAFAEDHKIQMLDTGADGLMIFEPAYVKANTGDTVTFIAKDPGHNIISRHVPEGAQNWKGAVSNNLTITLNKEGVYLYECDLHRMLGMVGVIQVGKPVNLTAAKAVAAELSKKMAAGGERLQEYLAKVQ